MFKNKKKKEMYFKYVIMSFFIIILGCSNQENKRNITIATAANMQFVMEVIVEEFSKKTGITCELIIGSSGKLTAQIKEGAPYDVFVAANLKYPKEIYNSGFAKNPPKTYAYGKLVLWSAHQDKDLSIDMLTNDAIAHIAIANPKTAPYGIAALEVLNHYGVYDQLKNKLVFGESIAQVNQFVSSRAAEVGFTAMSVVQSPRMKNKGKWIAIEESSYLPIEQGIVMIKDEHKKNREAIAFYDFIFSAEAKKILTDFEYFVNE